jgi:hypothetical protein
MMGMPRGYFVTLLFFILLICEYNGERERESVRRNSPSLRVKSSSNLENSEVGLFFFSIALGGNNAY